MDDTIASAVRPRRGVYPGSFNPPTVAHLAIARLVVEQRRLDSLTFVVSQRALAKEEADAADRPRMADRVAVLEAMVANDDHLSLEVTEKQLIVDIAEGYDIVVVGADKWLQIQDPVFYNNDEVERDTAVAALPEVALIPRPPISTGDARTLVLDEQARTSIHAVSSSKARAGDRDLMVPAARAFDDATGAWTDPERYEQYLATLSD